MLQVKIDRAEMWDPDRQEFIYVEPTVLTLEHSLASISKWESKWLKPFLHNGEKSDEEVIDYIRCMTINDGVGYYDYYALSDEAIKNIEAYIKAPMTATFFGKSSSKKKSNRIITSELIYYWMMSLGIPLECEHWHLNRLLTLIQVFSEENKEPEKKSQASMVKDYAAINAARRAKLKSSG